MSNEYDIYWEYNKDEAEQLIVPEEHKDSFEKFCKNQGFK